MEPLGDDDGDDTLASGPSSDAGLPMGAATLTICLLLSRRLADIDIACACAPCVLAATVTKLIKEQLPEGLRCHADVAPLVQACLSEFLQMLTAQANEKATAEKKNTINESHALKALEELGFGHYHTDAQGAAAPGEERKKAKKPKKGLSSSGLSEEELLKMQQELFASARQSVSATEPPAPIPALPPPTEQ